MPKPKLNADNERIKLQYFHFLTHADGKAEATIRQIEKAIRRFEEFTHAACFKTFDQRQAVAFKQNLAKQDIALATVHSTINSVKRFFSWLAMQPGFKSRIQFNAIEYLNLSDKDTRAAKAPSEKRFPTLQMIETVVAAVQKRDQALIALTAITGIRDGALISLKLKHFDTTRRLILQNPNEVKTKFAKRIDTFLIPLNQIFEPIVMDYESFLRDQQLFADDDPLFPRTLLGQDANNCFAPCGLSREHWSTASPVRLIFKTAFRRANLPETTPHLFRDMIVSEMYRRELPVPVCKAWSQNLGHEGAMTTLTSYGKIGLEEQGRLVRKESKRSDDDLLSQIKELVKGRS